MEVKRYYLNEIRGNKFVISKITSLIQETFATIAYLYADDNPFKQQVMGDLATAIAQGADSEVFYLVEDNKLELLGCLRGFIKKENLNPEMGEGNLFYSKYIGVSQVAHRQGIGTILKKSFEYDAQVKASETHTMSMVISRIIKSNDISREWNIANGYTEWDEGDGSEYVQYYKTYGEDSLK